MPAIDLLTLLSTVNPTVGEIESLFKGLSKISPSILQVLLKSVDENMIAKIAQWSTIYIGKVNDLGPAPIDQNTMNESNESADSSNFMDVMKGTKYVGPRLSAQDLDTASNMLTKAIKANNWEQAIQVGIAIAQLAPLLPKIPGLPI